MMSSDLPEQTRQAFETYDAFERDGDSFTVTTTVFDNQITAETTDEWTVRYVVTVRPPTIENAVAGEVGLAVANGWFETFERRLEDAPKATRATVDLTDFQVRRDGETVVVTYEFEFGDADRAAAIAKTFVEYVEGTYVEGVIPGYDYTSPVADLLSDARSTGGDGSDSTSLL